MAQPRRIYVDGASVICGFACYFPILGFRGAAFCLFPGIAQRSWRIALKGAGLGFLADICVTIAWMFIGGVWEPRSSYNHTLVHNLPPDFMVATHVGSPMPNSMKFGLGLIFWTSTMYAIWMSLWTPKLEWERRIPIIAIGAMAVGVCSATLWIVAPLDGWWHHGAQPFGDLAPESFLAVFLTTMPTCSFIVALLIYFTSKRQHAATLTAIAAEQIDEHGADDNAVRWR